MRDIAVCELRAIAKNSSFLSTLNNPSRSRQNFIMLPEGITGLGFSFAVLCGGSGTSLLESLNMQKMVYF